MYLTIFAIVYFTHDPNASYPPLQTANILAIRISPFVFAVGFVWMAVSWFTGDSMMLATAGAREIKRDDNPEVYSLVKNTSIAAGLPMPRVFIMPDDSLNAFATGRSPEHSAVILTRGIVKKLNRSELEGVVAHEMAHIGNRDVRNMMLVITGVGIITLTGELMFRFGIRMRGKKSPGPIIALLGIVLMIYGMFLAPLIMYALSRRREYQADATGALITRNPDALASALAKISVDSRVEALDSVALMSAACISHAGDEKSSFTSFFSELYSTHPPVEKRIQALNEMSGNADG
jgi:heat shock protein HtpX